MQCHSRSLSCGCLNIRRIRLTNQSRRLRACVLEPFALYLASLGICDYYAIAVQIKLAIHTGCGRQSSKRHSVDDKEHLSPASATARRACVCILLCLFCCFSRPFNIVLNFGKTSAPHRLAKQAPKHSSCVRCLSDCRYPLLPSSYSDLNRTSERMISCERINSKLHASFACFAYGALCACLYISLLYGSALMHICLNADGRLGPSWPTRDTFWPRVKTKLYTLSMCSCVFGRLVSVARKAEIFSRLVEPAV